MSDLEELMLEVAKRYVDADVEVRISVSVSCKGELVGRVTRYIRDDAKAPDEVSMAIRQAIGAVTSE